MRLPLFILERRELIMAEWESFAGTLLPAAEGMSIEGLRDRASEMLTAIAADMAQAQTASEQRPSPRAGRCNRRVHPTPPLTSTAPRGPRLDSPLNK